MPQYNNIVLFGGTFDPVHYGHLFIIKQLIELFDINNNNVYYNNLKIIPNNIPPHKINKTNNITNNYHRLAMLKLALLDFIDSDKYNNSIEIDTCELDRQGPSYMADTISSIKKNIKNYNLWLVLGEDSFYSLSKWHNPQYIIQSTNFIIINRNIKKNINNNSWAEEYIKNNQITKQEFDSYLHNNISGKVYILNNELIDISATYIREMIQNSIKNKNTITNLEKYIPKSVINYIIDNNLYTE